MSAVKQDSLFDKGTTVFVFLGFAMPTFWLALLLMILFGVKLDWLPISGLHSLNYGELSFSGADPGHGKASDHAGFCVRIRRLGRDEPVYEIQHAGGDPAGLRYHCSGQGS